MKKSMLTGVFLVFVIIVIGVVGYFYMNSVFEKKAKIELTKILEKENLANDFHYKNIKANFLLREITLRNAELTLENKGEMVGKIFIKTVTLKGNLNNDYKINFKNLKFTNLSAKIDEKLAGKTILTAEKGNIEYKNKEGKIKYELSIKKIKLNNDFFQDRKNNSKKLRELLKDVLEIGNPINIEANIKADKNKKTFKIKEYKIKWSNNLTINYSIFLKNIDFDNINKIAKEMNSSNGKNNPMLTFELIGELAKIQPIKLEFSIKDNGIKERVIAYTEKNDNITKKQIIEQVKEKLLKSPFSEYSKPIINFIEKNKGKLEITIENPQDLQIKDIFHKAKSIEDLTKILKIKLTN